jgi:hypothetical protein
MTTIEHTPERVPPDCERPVFLAENGRRARILGIAAKIAFAVTVLWLAALAAGMLGFGQLPGTSIEQPFNRLIGGGGDQSKNQAPSTGSGSVTASARERAARAQAIVVAKRNAVARAATARARAARGAGPAPALPAQPPAGQAAVAQQPRQQGWTRQGYVAPPGQVRKAETPAPAPTPPGNALGRVKKTTPVTPPPPPPPPPGNGNGNGGGKLK